MLLPLSVLLIASFALWGITDVFNVAARDVIIAEVGDVEIDGNDFLRLYNAQTEEIRSVLGRDLDFEMGKKLGFIDSVVSDLVNRALFDQASLDLGLAAGDALARQAIFASSDFHDETGSFNELKFRQVLRQNLYTEDRFVEGLRQDMRRQQLTFSLTSFEDVPQSIMEPLVSYRGEARAGTTMLLTLDSVPFNETIPLQEQKDWYESNKDMLMTPPYRRIHLLALDVFDLRSELAIDDKDIENLYTQRKAFAYTKPERRDLYQMLSDDEELIRQAIERVRKGEDVLAVAKDLFGSKKEDVDIGWNRKDQMIEELADAVFGLEKGKISDALQSPFGWHAVLVRNIEEEKITPLDEVQDALRDELIMDEGIELVFDIYGQVEDVFAAGGVLADAAQAIDHDIRVIDSIDRQGLSAEGTEVASVKDKERFLTQAFRLAVGETSAVFETETGFFVFSVEAETPARQKTFAEAQDEVITALSNEKKTALLQKRVDRLVALVNKGESLQKRAEAENLKIVTLEPFTRSNFVEDKVPGEMVEAFFQAELNEAVAVQLAGGSYMIGVLDKIIATQADENEEQRNLKARIAESLRNDLITQYARYLRLLYPVTINERAIEELL